MLLLKRHFKYVSMDYVMKDTSVSIKYGRERNIAILN